MLKFLHICLRCCEHAFMSSQSTSRDACICSSHFHASLSTTVCPRAKYFQVNVRIVDPPMVELHCRYICVFTVVAMDGVRRARFQALARDRKQRTTSESVEDVRWTVAVWRWC